MTGLLSHLSRFVLSAHLVSDNTELIQIRDSLIFIQRKLLKLILLLSEVAAKYRSLATLGFTHFQPAQLTTYISLIS